MGLKQTNNQTIDKNGEFFTYFNRLGLGFFVFLGGTLKASVILHIFGCWVVGWFKFAQFDLLILLSEELEDSCKYSFIYDI